MTKTHWLSALVLILALVLWSGVFVAHADESTGTDATDTTSAASEEESVAAPVVETPAQQVETDADSAASEDAEADIDEEMIDEENEGSWFDIIKPNISYNPIEKWHFGLTFNNSFASTFADFYTVKAYGTYSFPLKKLDYGFSYTLDGKGTKFDYYTSYEDIIRNHGLYNNTLLWQHDKLARIGFSNNVSSAIYDDSSFMRYIDFRVEYHERAPKNNVGLPFDSGQDLAISPSIKGYYNGFSGNFSLVYGVPTSISDYNYIRVEGMVKQRIDLNRSNRLYLSASAGLINGDYPYERSFFLGSSKSNFMPSIQAKFADILSYKGFATLNSPAIALDGFAENAFVGDKKGIAKLEYQYSPEALAGLENFVQPWIKVYGIVGDAWTGEISAFKPHVAIGAGLNLAMAGKLATEGSYFGLNITQGFGEDAAFTIGFDSGMMLNLTR